MVIEVKQVDRAAVLDVTEAPLRAPASNRTANPAPAPAVVAAAVQDIQGALNSGPNPSFTLDYLSGLSVVTVRSTLTGEVVFQLPDTRAVELARLLRQGESLSSLGLLHTTA